MKNVLKIWKEKNQILEGIKNNIFKTEHVEEIANERLEICNSCSLLDNEGKKCLVPGTNPCCGSCGCSLKLKVRSLGSDCPEGKWNAILSHEENYFLQKKLSDEQSNNSNK